MEPSASYQFHDLVANYLNGGINDSYVMIKLMIQCIAVLVAGLVLWRVSSIFSKKKNKQRRRSMFMDSRFHEQWKNKI